MCVVLCIFVDWSSFLVVLSRLPYNEPTTSVLCGLSRMGVSKSFAYCCDFYVCFAQIGMIHSTLFGTCYMTTRDISSTSQGRFNSLGARHFALTNINLNQSRDIEGILDDAHVSQ